MAEDQNQNQNAPAADDPASQAGGGQQQTSQAGDAGQQTTDDLSKLTPEQLREQLANERKDRQAANREAQKFRKELKELQDAEDKRKQAELSDLEKAQKAAKDAESREAAAMARVVDAEIKVAASQAGFKNPDFAVKLIDRSQLVNGDDGMPTNVKDLCDALIKANPELKGAASSNLPSSQQTQPGNTNGSQLDKSRTEQAVADFGFLKGRVANQ